MREEKKMYSDFYNTDYITSTSSVDSTWMIISAIVALIGGIVIYLLFVSKKNNGEYTGFVAWLHDFLNFKTFFIEVVLKTLYVIFAIFITLSSFSFLSSSVAIFFLWLILGNIINRVVYEFILMFLTLVNNTSEINKKLVSHEPEKTTVKTRKKEEKTVENPEDEA